jgi:glucoamylase
MLQNPNSYAPGAPGIPPRLTSSAKTGVGTAHSYQSPLWFTFSHGILNELFYPGVDKACTRDMEFIITDGKDLFSEEKRIFSTRESPRIRSSTPAPRVSTRLKRKS